MITLIDSALAKRNNLFRKGVAYAHQVPRTFRRVVASSEAYSSRPPVIANSIPKSGTHLLLQITRALPGTVYYGSFLAWSTSWSLKARSQQEMNFHINRIVPGETLGAHLHWSDETARRLEAINALHLLIIRDPRDIALSEAEYLAHMNRFHRMHRHFARVSDPKERLRMVLEGVPEVGGLFPQFANRIEPYLGWLNEANCMVVRYEDLRTPSTRYPQLVRIAQKWTQRCDPGYNVEMLAARLEQAIAPERSHTFREGGVQKWRRFKDKETVRLLKAHSERVVSSLGYDSSSS